MTITKAKNEKTREVPISDFFLEVLKRYSIKRLEYLADNDKRSRRFFIAKNGKPITGKDLNESLKQIIKRTGNNEIISKHITLHCLRHSIATHLLDAGESFDYVRSFLGHAFIDTTQLYAKRRRIKNIYAL